MRKAMIAAALLTTLPLGACVSGGWGSGGGYGDGRVLSDNDVIYRGDDGRYYCKRDDGTKGLIVGGLAGGVLGNIIAPGGSKTLGTILGAGAGALAGREIDRSGVRCR